jgi:hypothetical protein
METAALLARVFPTPLISAPINSDYAKIPAAFEIE